MNVRTKIRLLNHVRKVFPEWAIERQAIVIEHAFIPDLAKAKGDAEAKQAIVAQRDAEADEYWSELAERRSRRLVRRARKLFISLDGLKWSDGNYGYRYLEDESEAQLYRAVLEETRKIWDFRIKVIGALTGLIGTIIGLVAIWKR